MDRHADNWQPAFPNASFGTSSILCLIEHTLTRSIEELRNRFGKRFGCWTPFLPARWLRTSPSEWRLATWHVGYRYGHVWPKNHIRSVWTSCFELSTGAGNQLASTTVKMERTIHYYSCLFPRMQILSWYRSRVHVLCVEAMEKVINVVLFRSELLCLFFFPLLSLKFMHSIVLICWAMIFHVKMITWYCISIIFYSYLYLHQNKHLHGLSLSS